MPLDLKQKLQKEQPGITEPQELMNAVICGISETNVNSIFEIKLNGERLVLKRINRLKCNVKEVKRNF